LFNHVKREIFFENRERNHALRTAVSKKFHASTNSFVHLPFSSLTAKQRALQRDSLNAHSVILFRRR